MKGLKKLPVIDRADHLVKRQSLANGSGRVPNKTLNSRMVGSNEFEIYPADPEEILPFNWPDLVYQVIVAQCNFRGIQAPEQVIDRSSFVGSNRLKLRSSLPHDENDDIIQLKYAIKMAAHNVGNSFETPEIKIRKKGARTFISTGLTDFRNTSQLVLSNAELVLGVHAEHFSFYRPRKKGLNYSLGFIIDCTRWETSGHGRDDCQKYARDIIRVLWMAK